MDGEARMSDVKVYESEGIRVFWEAKRCIHWANCIRGLPEVFDPRDRPWIKADQATAEEVAQVVLRCPSGALHFERKDGGAAESHAEATITVVPNGPLFVRGEARLTNRAGETIVKDTRVALCRCGHSENKPFCDNSHMRIGFKG